MKGYGWYFLVVGLLGIIMALSRAENETEFFFTLATVPTAFLIVRFAGFLSKRNKE